MPLPRPPPPPPPKPPKFTMQKSTVKSRGNVDLLPLHARVFVQHWVRICQPGGVYICDGSRDELENIVKPWVDAKIVHRLGLSDSGSPSLLFRTNSKDAGGTFNSKTFFVDMNNYEETTPIDGGGVANELTLNQWRGLDENFMSAMKELVRDHWPCDPSNAFQAYHPNDLRIKSYGASAFSPSECLLPSMLDQSLGRPERWMVTCCSILSIITPHGKEFFVALAMAQGCDLAIKMAESKHTLPGYVIKIVALSAMTYLWMDDKSILRAGNPLAGFSGIGNAEVTRDKTPGLFKTLRSPGALFLNTAVKNQHFFLWEGMEAGLSEDDKVIDWHGLPWCAEEGCAPKRQGGDDCGASCRSAAHPKCRYFCDYHQYPCVHRRWNDPKGVPLNAIIFGGKRSQEVPLVYECKNWVEGILTGVCLKTETNTSSKGLASGDCSTRDPMAMGRQLKHDRLGRYLKRWLQWDTRSTNSPRIFRVNWWAKGSKQQDNSSSSSSLRQGTWPGVSECSRLLDWILRRCDDHKDIAIATPIGYLPRIGTINTTGLENVDIQPLLTVDKTFWLEELARDIAFLEEQTDRCIPPTLLKTLKNQEAELVKATNQDLGLNTNPCEGPVNDKCFICLGHPFHSKGCKCTT